jgi:hypothetical protein
MLAGALVVGWVSSSFGDDAVVAQRDAQMRFNEGLARVQAGNFEGARMSFTQAYAVLHKPDILWNLALAEEKCGVLLPALQHFKDYSHQVTDAGERQAASRHMQELAAKTGHIDIVAPAGATLVVDGVTVGEAPLGEPVDVEAGRHRVVARTGGVAKSAESEVTPGQLVHVSFVMIEADASASPPGPSAVPVPVPLVTPPEAPSANVAGVERPRPTRAAGSFWTPRVVVSGSLGVAAVSAGVVGYVLGQRADSNFNSAQRLRATYPDCLNSSSQGCSQLHDKVSAQHEDAVASQVLWTVGGVLLAGAVVTWFVWPRALSNVAGGSGFRVMPSVGVDGAGALVSGTF